MITCYTIIGDTSSKSFQIDIDELYDIEKNESEYISKELQSGNNTHAFQRRLARFLSVSFYGLGGHHPLRVRNSTTEHTVRLAKYLHEEYSQRWILEIYKMLLKFDRSKGCWTQYVRFAKGKALHATCTKDMRLKKCDEVLYNAFEMIKNGESVLKITLGDQDADDFFGQELSFDDETLDEDYKETFADMARELEKIGS